MKVGDQFVIKGVPFIYTLIEDMKYDLKISYKDPTTARSEYVIMKKALLMNAINAEEVHQIDSTGAMTAFKDVFIKRVVEEFHEEINKEVKVNNYFSFSDL
jgi:hypothetical protein